MSSEARRGGEFLTPLLGILSVLSKMVSVKLVSFFRTVKTIL